MFQRTVPVLPKAQLTRMLPVLLIPALIIIVPVPAADPTFAKDCAFPFCATIDKQVFGVMHEK
jgi:hypothetical protein